MLIEKICSLIIRPGHEQGKLCYGTIERTERMKRLPTPAEMEARLREIAQRRNAQAREEDQSTKAPMMVSGNEGSRDQGIKDLVSSKPDQGVFDSTDETMFEKYGDIIGFVNGHPLCLKATKPKDEGGWGVFPQALTNAVKQSGCAKVLDALRYTANYRAAKDPAKFFWHQLKK